MLLNFSETFWIGWFLPSVKKCVLFCICWLSLIVLLYWCLELKPTVQKLKPTVQNICFSTFEFRNGTRPPCLVDSPMCLCWKRGGLFPCSLCPCSHLPLALFPSPNYHFPFLAFICEGGCWGGGGSKEFEVFLIAVLHSHHVL